MQDAPRVARGCLTPRPVTPPQRLLLSPAIADEREAKAATAVPQLERHEGERRTSYPGRWAVKGSAHGRVPRTRQARDRTDLVAAVRHDRELVARELVIAFAARTRPRSACRVIQTSPKTSCVNLLGLAVRGWLSSASRSARADRPLGDSGAGHPLGGSEVGHWARLAGDADGDVALRRAVSCGVVWGAVAPALPHDTAPGAADRADRAGVLMSALAGLRVEAVRPRVPVAA
jgi:hypothetical protein